MPDGSKHSPEMETGADNPYRWALGAEANYPSPERVKGYVEQLQDIRESAQTNPDAAKEQSLELAERLAYQIESKMIETGYEDNLGIQVGGTLAEMASDLGISDEDLEQAISTGRNRAGEDA